MCELLVVKSKMIKLQFIEPNRLGEHKVLSGSFISPKKVMDVKRGRTATW